MRLVILGLLAGLMVGPALAEEFDDPAQLVGAIYAQYRPGVAFPDGDVIRSLQSTRLNALYDADAAEAGDEIGRIDFDPYVNGQDYDLKGLEIAAPYYAGGKALVQVKFSNFEAPQDVGIVLVKEGAGWKVDDVWTASPDYSYDLLDLLQAPLN